MRVGYIGLGLMGKPCALHLLNAGYELYVWARRPEALTDLIAAGAKKCDSIAAVAQQVDVLFLNLSDTPDVAAVLLGELGVHATAKPGLVVVDMSTISPLETRRMAATLAEKNIELVDAPVSGGTVGAQQGTLTFMVGSSEKTFERVYPLLATMGKTITRIGESGAGQVAKACNQIVISGTIAAVAEAISFAHSCDVDPAPVREALLGGFAQSRVLELHGKRMLSNEYAPGFKATLHLKDMNIVAATAKDTQCTLPITALVTDILRDLVATGDGELDSSAIYKLIAAKK